MTGKYRVLGRIMMAQAGESLAHSRTRRRKISTATPMRERVELLAQQMTLEQDSPLAESTVLANFPVMPRL